jgi:hypothetical protein
VGADVKRGELRECRQVVSLARKHFPLSPVRRCGGNQAQRAPISASSANCRTSRDSCTPEAWAFSARARRRNRPRPRDRFDQWKHRSRRPGRHRAHDLEDTATCHRAPRITKRVQRHRRLKKSGRDSSELRQTRAMRARAILVFLRQTPCGKSDFLEQNGTELGFMRLASD